MADRFMAGVFWTMALCVGAVFFWIVGTIVWNGAASISWEFLTTEPANNGREGGIGPILVSTGMILFVAMVVSFPIGLGTAILLAEFTREDNWFGRLVRRSLDVLAGVPSIVFGLFGSVFFCQVLDLGFSIWSGGLTLACMVLPILIRASEEGLRAVPADYRMSAASLGISRTSTLFKLILPAALPGLMAGFVLGLGRAAAETAALIFTSGAVDRWPESFEDSGRALTVHIYELAMNVPGGNENAYGTACVLVSLLLLTNYLANLAARRWIGRQIVTQ